MIEVVEPAKPFSSEPPKKTRISVYDYDLNEAKKQFNSVLSSLLMMSVMHFWLKFTQPLIIQSLLPWKNFFTLPVVKIRILGYAAEDKLERPWKVASPFGDLMNQMTATEEEPAKEIEGEAVVEETVTSKKHGQKGGKKGSKEEKATSPSSPASGVNSETETESKASGVKSRKPRKEE